MSKEAGIPSWCCHQKLSCENTAGVMVRQEKQSQQGLRDVHSSFPYNSCIPALPSISTEKTLKGRTHTALLMTHLMCEATQYSRLKAFSYETSSFTL